MFPTKALLTLLCTLPFSGQASQPGSPVPAISDSLVPSLSREPSSTLVNVPDSTNDTLSGQPADSARTVEEIAPVRDGQVLETRNLEKTVIKGVSKAAAVKRTAYNVNAIDVTKLKEKNIAVNEILNQSPGVVVREEGGMGSGSSISLNGMSGNQVKVFLDGLPMENAGSAMGMNNFPANSIETIEVYKGVVPIHLGSDALGGAIDIRTNSRHRPFLDASYAYSSFNTHRAALSGQWVPDSTRVLVKAGGFYNSSDNDYEVVVRPADWNTGTYGPEERLRRFHDGYSSYQVSAEAGVFKLAYADLATLGYSRSADHDDIQHAVSMDRVFGKVFNETETHDLTGKYRKQGLFLEGLSVTAYASALWTDYEAVDTVARQYDWRGNFRPQNNADKGEAEWKKTLFSSENRSISSNFNLSYQFPGGHQLAVNHALTQVRQLGNDRLDEFAHDFDEPATILDQVYAASYKKDLFGDRFSATAFAKLYRMSPEYRTYDFEDGEEIASSTDRTDPGYGLAATLFAGKSLQFKLSYENAVRMPESGEVFGDAILQKGNPDLKPERSQNINGGALFGGKFPGWKLNAEGNFFYRNVTDLIRQDNQGLITKYVNQSKVLVTGTEGEVSVDWKRRIEAGVNATYQELINTTEYEDGRLSDVYLDRIPNIPYLVGNAFISANWPRPLGIPGRLSASANSHFVEEYFLTWASQGDPSTKYTIPRQLIHGLGLVYAAPADTYSVSFECENVSDEMAYDNFRMQKPGRSFSGKIRYSL
jgi:outer membrane cobalamin receptor